jgi:hypothetical protein
LLTGLAAVHYVAIALHPERKPGYFRAEWADKPGWVAIAKSETFTLWNEEYKYLASTISESDMMISDDPSEDVQWRRNKRARLTSDISDAFEAFRNGRGRLVGLKED